MIDRATIEGQMQALQQQRQAKENDIKAIDGALQLCRHWLAVCVAREQEQQAAEQPQAECNGLANDMLLPANEN